MNKENCALKLVDEIILYYDARSKKTSNDETKSLFAILRLRPKIRMVRANYLLLGRSEVVKHIIRRRQGIFA